MVARKRKGEREGRGSSIIVIIIIVNCEIKRFKILPQLKSCCLLFFLCCHTGLPGDTIRHIENEWGCQHFSIAVKLHCEYRKVLSICPTLKIVKFWLGRDYLTVKVSSEVPSKLQWETSLDSCEYTLTIIKLSHKVRDTSVGQLWCVCVCRYVCMCWERCIHTQRSKQMMYTCTCMYSTNQKHFDGLVVYRCHNKGTNKIYFLTLKFRIK